MKTKKLLLGLTLAISIIGCNSSSSNSPTQTENVKVSKCQNKAQRNNTTEESIDNKHTYVSYKYENSTLFLKHYNSSFNCKEDAPISADIEKKGNKINIKETQDLSNGRMRCMCLRDLDITVNEISADVYEIHIDDNSADDEILFTVNLEEKKEGMVSYERLTYPYGSN